MELSWSLRTRAGDPLECEQANIARIRLCWQPVGDAGIVQSCVDDQYRTFPCDDKHGVTRFEVSPGQNAVWIEPMCAGGRTADPATYQVPAPIVRNVIVGEVVTLDSLLLVVTDKGDCSENCTCLAAR